jgi:acetyl-CoA C-acetyltransferase
MDKMKEDIVIVAGVRTAIGTFLGMYRDIRDLDLSKVIMTEVVKRAGMEDKKGMFDDVRWGCCYQRTDEINIGRIAAVFSGIPAEVPAVTIHRTCNSAMEAMVSGAQIIKAGDGEIILAGGTDSMSTVPYVIRGARNGLRVRHAEIRDGMWEGLTETGLGPAMGITAENVAEKYNITRQAQDELAYNSQVKAARAIKEGRFKDEIIPVPVPQRRGEPKMEDTDEHPRPNTTLETLAKLPPAFKKDGTVTAGNASGINDGSSAVIIMKRSKADELGIKPLAKLVSYGLAGVDPDYMGIGPIPATKKALERANLTINDIELMELNEAFAAQALAVIQELKLKDRMDIINVNGGAIALGHPVGCSGTRIIISLMYEMIKRDLKLGLATLCAGGGMGMTVIIEKE